MAAARNTRVLLVAMALAVIAVTLDFFVMSVALSDIARDLDAGTSAVSWTFTAYLLASAAALPVAGALGDRWGQRRTFLAGVGLFTIASAAAIPATDEPWLIATRTVQGAGAAVMFTVSLAIVNAAYDVDRRAQAIGVWVGAGAIGSALGPFAGGAITEALSWRWIFVLNVVLGLAVVALALATVPRRRTSPVRRPLDLAGLLTATAGLAMLVLGLQQGQAWGWTSPATLVLCAAGVAALVAFTMIERRSPSPLIDLALFADRRFSGSTAVGFLINAARAVLIVLLAQWLQTVRGMSPLEAGLAITPLSVAVAVAAPLAGRMAARFGARAAVCTGTLLMAAAFVPLAMLSATTSAAVLAIVLLASGVGFAFTYAVTMTVGIAAVPTRLLSAGSATMSTIRVAGAAIGLAAALAVQTAVERARLDDVVGTVPRALEATSDLLAGRPSARAELAALPDVGASGVSAVVDTAASQGLAAAMLLCLGITTLAALIAFRTLPTGRPESGPARVKTAAQ